jgi:hypothetical protein
MLVLASLLLYGAWANAQTTTAFTYQGKLDNNGARADGSFDLQFTIFDAATNGNVIAGPLTNAATPISNGLFSVALDFGASAFTGPPRWLQIGVRTNGSTNTITNTFTILTPLQPVLAAPYAITANSASNLLGTVAATQLTGSLSTAVLPAGLVTNNQTGVTLGGTFSGNASGLTALNASQLTSGTVGLAELPIGGPTGLVTNGATFINLSGTFGGFFNGNGSGLNTLTAGTLIGTVPNTALNGVTISGGTFSGNGAGLTNLTFAGVLSTNATNFTLSIGGNDTNFAQLVGTALTNFSLAASNNVMLIDSNALYVASNNVMLIDSNALYVASNALYSAATSAASPTFGCFYLLSPPDDPDTIAPGTAVQFPEDGPANNISRISSTDFNLPAIGVYEVTWQVSITEAGQLDLALNGVEQLQTVVGRAVGTSQIMGDVLIQTVVVNTALEVRNAAGNDFARTVTPLTDVALTVTPFAGGNLPVTGTLVIKRIQ